MEHLDEVLLGLFVSVVARRTERREAAWSSILECPIVQ